MWTDMHTLPTTTCNLRRRCWLTVSGGFREAAVRLLRMPASHWMASGKLLSHLGACLAQAAAFASQQCGPQPTGKVEVVDV